MLDEERGAKAKIASTAIAAFFMSLWWAIETSIRRLGVYVFFILSCVFRETIGAVLTNDITVQFLLLEG